MTAVVEYYDDLQKYYESITARIDAMISLKNARGQRTSLMDMIQRYGALLGEEANLKKGLFEYQTGTSDETPTYEEALRRYTQTASTNIIDSELAVKLASSASSLDLALRTDAKISKGLQKENARNNTLLSDNIETTKLYTKIQNKAMKAAQKNSASSKKKEEKLNKQLADLTDVEQKVLSIRGNEDVMNSTIFRSTLSDLSKLMSSGGNISKSKQTKMDMYSDTLQALAQHATTDNVSLYKTLYEKWWKLDNKRQNKGLNAKQQTSYTLLSDSLEELNEASAREVRKAMRELKKAYAKANPNEATLREALDAEKEELSESYQEQRSIRSHEVKGTTTYAKYMTQANKKSATKSAQGKAVVEALDKYGNAENAEQLAKAVADMNKYAGKSGKKKQAKYEAAKNQYEAIVKQQQAEQEAAEREYRDAMEQAEKEFQQQVEEMKAAELEKTAQIFEALHDMLFQQIELIKAEIEYLDSAMSKMESLVNLYKDFDVKVLKNKYGLEGLTGIEDSIELMRDVYKEMIESGTEKLEKTRKKRDAYEQLKTNAESKTAEGKTDWSSVFSSIKSSDEYKGNEELRNWIADAEKRLAENEDYDTSTWLEEIKQGFNDASVEVYDTITQIQTFKDEMRENVTFKAVNNAIQAVERLNNHLRTSQEYINEDWYFDANGITRFGLAQINLLAEERDNSLKEAEKYKEKMNEIMSETDWANDEKKVEALEEARAGYWEALQNGESAALQIYDLWVRKQEEEISTLEKTISLRQKAIDKQREYYEYQKNINNKNKDLQSIEAQIQALTNINTAESKARVQQLEAERKNLQDELDDMRQEHLYDLQVKALDELVDKLSLALDKSTEDITTTIEEFQRSLNEAIENSLGTPVNEILQTITNAVYGPGKHTNSIRSAEDEETIKDLQQKILDAQTTINATESGKTTSTTNRDTVQNRINEDNAKLNANTIATNVANINKKYNDLLDYTKSDYYDSYEAYRYRYLYEKYATKDNLKELNNLIREIHYDVFGSPSNPNLRNYDTFANSEYRYAYIEELVEAALNGDYSRGKNYSNIKTRQDLINEMNAALNSAKNPLSQSELNWLRNQSASELSKYQTEISDETATINSNLDDIVSYLQILANYDLHASEEIKDLLAKYNISVDDIRAATVSQTTQAVTEATNNSIQAVGSSSTQQLSVLNDTSTDALEANQTIADQIQNGDLVPVESVDVNIVSNITKPLISALTTNEIPVETISANISTMNNIFEAMTSRDSEYQEAMRAVTSDIYQQMFVIVKAIQSNGEAFSQMAEKISNSSSITTQNTTQTMRLAGVVRSYT